MKKIMIIGELPAPYRVQVFKEFSRLYDVDIFFEMYQDTNRVDEWLQKKELDCYILDNNEAIRKWFKSIFEIRKYDLVLLYINTLKYSMITELFCKIMKVPYFINCDGCNDIEENNAIKYYIKKFFMRGAKGYLAGGRIAKQYFEYFGVPSDAIWIHNFSSSFKKDQKEKLLSIEEKNELKRLYNITEEFVVISVGRHIPCKGFDVLALAASKLDKSIGVYIIGGEPNVDLKQYCETNKIYNVHFVDFLNKKVLSDYLQSADVFTLMTRGDTWGLVINEAMENGLPIVTTKRCVAGKELIYDEKGGFLLEVDDVDGLVDAILYLRENPEIRYNMAVHNLDVIKNYNLEHMISVDCKAIKSFFCDGS